MIFSNTVDRNNLAAHADTVVTFRLLNKDSPQTDFFDSSKHPKATYKSTRIVFKGDTPVAVEGNLTIKGTTKPVTMTIDSFSAKEHPMKRKDALGAKAHMKIKRSDFGLSKFVPAVSDDVLITIRVEAVAE